MRVTLLGAGNTTGTPIAGYDCETCLTACGRGIERTCFSVHVQNERTGRLLLVDSSSGFRHQFLTQSVPLSDEASVTHIHFDYFDGLDNVYHFLDDLSVYAADEIDSVTGKNVADAIRSRFDYLDRISVEDRTPFEPLHACGLDVIFVPITHPPPVCYGAIIEDPEAGAKLSLSGDMTYTIPKASRGVLHNPDPLLVKAIVSASVCEYHPIGGNDHDEDGVAWTFGTKHVVREGVITLDEELNTDETHFAHIARYYPADEVFEEPLAVGGETCDL